MFDPLGPHGLYSPWNSPGQNTGVSSLSLLQGIFPTQRLIPGLRHCRWILYHLSHKGSPRILEWVAYPFSSGFFRSRNQTRVFCIAGGFFTNWAIREALSRPCISLINPNSLGHQLFTSFLFVYLFILFLATLGLYHYMPVFSRLCEWRLLFVAMSGLILAVASLVTEFWIFSVAVLLPEACGTMSPALAGGFLTTRPPGKTLICLFWWF